MIQSFISSLFIGTLLLKNYYYLFSRYILNKKFRITVGEKTIFIFFVVYKK